MNVYLSLGSNIGNREEYIRKAISSLRNLGDMKCSSIYETAPWGNVKQEDFLNSVCLIKTDKSASEIFSFTNYIEKSLERERIKKWGPRTIDIDVLFYGDRIIHTSEIEIPHPNITSRKFVLIPLNEIAPDFVHPVFKKTVKQMLKECKDKGEVKLWQSGDLLQLKV